MSVLDWIFLAVAIIALLRMSFKISYYKQKLENIEGSKIYISGYCNTYHEDGTHHEINRRPLQEALEIMTDDWLNSGNCCDQTIIDMRDSLKISIKRG